MTDIPTWMLGATAAFLFGLAGVVARSMFTTVRRASLVVNANESLQATVSALRDHRMPHEA